MMLSQTIVVALTLTLTLASFDRVAAAVRGNEGGKNKPGKPGKQASKGLNFFFFGDWGYNVPAAQSESGVDYEGAKVANQVNAYATQILPQFIAVLGDNFYNVGVANTTDPIWELYYRSLYTAPATFVPWYPVMGNHEYYGVHNPQAEIDYYKQHIDSRWTFPDYQYTRTWNIPGTSKTMEIVFINTVTLCPESESSGIGWPANPTGAYPNPDPAANIINQYIAHSTLQWIENALAASKADLLMVAGHYHIYTNTIGDVSGTPEGYCLQDRLVPLLKQYGVTAYINGHEHNFEHFVLDGISYFTAGHGTDKDDPISDTGFVPPGLLFNLTVGGFASAKVSPNALTVDFIDVSGSNIYSYTSQFNPTRRALLRA